MTVDVEWAIRGIARRDKGAFSSLYASQQPRLLNYATGLLAGDRAAAEDVVDDAFVAIWQQAGRFEDRGSAEGWLLHIVRNKAIDHIRRTSRAPLAGADEIERHHSMSDRTSQFEPEKNIEAFELRRVLERLSSEHREVIWLCYFEERPLAEIAALVGCPEGTVKTRLFHARKAMRGFLKV